VFLKQLKFPVSFVDFESYASPIPLHDGTKPYQQIVFQYSLHVVRSPGAEPEHFSFLAEGTGDPRPEFMRSLRAALPSEGSVVGYNSSFEVGRLKECCDLMPEFQPWVNDIERRIVDLLVPFRSFRFHDAKQSGSCSLKKVLPVLTAKGYDKLAIQDGTTASLEFLRVHFTDVPVAERQRVRRALEIYCGQDTEALTWVVAALRNLAAKA
jgi:hypothetical protein